VKRVAILGATGSIGAQALDVAADHPGLQVVALAANGQDEALVTAAHAHGAEHIALRDPAAAARARTVFDGHVHEGPQAAAELVRAAGADVVLNAIVGAAGLEASLATLEGGADLALANKESLVAGGPLVLDALRRSGRRLLPVDSEHSALQQCLGSEPRDALEGLVITASGGPFRGRTRAELAEVTVDDALAHPTWAMGAKITVDSATLMNKGLEVIEAHVLFDLPYDRIEVVVHPQSIVHGMARFRDGALLAHVGHPDMRVPISYALTYPERAATAAPRFDLDRAFSLDFEPPDTATFRCLALARAAGEAGGTSPCILNAANEEAVAAFLAGRVGFLDIDALVADALDRVASGPVDDLDAVRAADAAARAAVQERRLAGVAR
jgi:1-deoxy-D-xylulose-5-phosphate reductoisomerase